jgi:hypothetical protein
MFGFFTKRSARKKADLEFAYLRIELDAILKMVTSDEDPQNHVITMVRVGSHIRKSLEHRFGWAREVEISSDDDLRSEEKRLDQFSKDELQSLSKRIDKAANDAGQKEQVEKTIALRLLSGWLICKMMAKDTDDQKIIASATEHEEIYLSHIRNMMRILRGERPVLED